jgi:hypothetical protein
VRSFNNLGTNALLNDVARPAFSLFRWVKYATYLAVAEYLVLFAEEIDSARFALATGDEMAWGIQLFSATLDTLAWVIYLLLFELETAVIPDHRLQGRLRFAIHGVRMLCTRPLSWHFWATSGSGGRCYPVSCLGATPVLGCEGWSVMIKLDDFVPLSRRTAVSWRLILGWYQGWSRCGVSGWFARGSAFGFGRRDKLGRLDSGGDYVGDRSAICSRDGEPPRGQ